jgi:curved DNA-binding protein CbpA
VKHYDPQCDFYAVLGVGIAATADEIHLSWKRLLIKHHPDRNPADKFAEARCKLFNLAHDTLHNADERAKYDGLRADYHAQKQAVEEAARAAKAPPPPPPMPDPEIDPMFTPEEMEEFGMMTKMVMERSADQREKEPFWFYSKLFAAAVFDMYAMTLKARVRMQQRAAAEGKTTAQAKPPPRPGKKQTKRRKVRTA